MFDTPASRPLSLGGRFIGLGPLLGLCILALVGCGEPAGPPPEGEGLTAEIQRVLEIDDRLESIEQLAGLLRRLPRTAESADRVLEGLDRRVADRGDLELVLVAEWWVSFDADAALEWGRRSWIARHPRVQYAMTRTLARIDPKRAVAGFRGRADGSDYAETLQPIVVGWHESGEPGLVEYVQRLPSEKLQQMSLGTLTRLKVLDLGPDGAAEWAEQTVAGQPESFRRFVIQRVATAMTEVDPQKASVWVAKLLGEGETETLLPRVARRWSREDPQAALDWLRGIPPGKFQKQAVGQSFGRWFENDPQGSVSWLMAQGDDVGGIFAPATYHLIKTRADRTDRQPDYEVDWEENLELAMRIEDPELRWGAATRINQVWIRRDPEASRAWIASHDMPAGYVAKVEATGSQGMVERPAEDSPGS